MNTKSYKTNPDSDFPILPIGRNGEHAKKTTHCTAEEILGRVIVILERRNWHRNSIGDAESANKIKELIMEWHHS